ncbi:C-type lectin 37Db-like isoform X2 [Bactrocera neohumeralis]|uniref:C-type lectin 37Db-like isoform X2 n=1 Tax=Bactrocera neohumeralis TaxID=98809 RepID=UPI00216521CC|nr:C-type lectin 37Db-like isoform X2 [Bactrocera neohumeralis]
MGLTQYFILILCFAGVLPQSINISNHGENETQPFIEIGSKYYLINTATTMNWFGAVLFCRNYDSDLAVIESLAEMNALSFYLTTNEGHIGKNFWLGLTDLADEGKFMSLKDGRPMLYAKWAGGQPDNAGQNEDCVHLWAFENIFYMNDNNCMAQHYAICELRQPKKTCDVCDLKNFMERFMQHTNVPNCRN